MVFLLMEGKAQGVHKLDVVLQIHIWGTKTFIFYIFTELNIVLYFVTSEGMWALV